MGSCHEVTHGFSNTHSGAERLCSLLLGIYEQTKTKNKVVSTAQKTYFCLFCLFQKSTTHSCNCFNQEAMLDKFNNWLEKSLQAMTRSSDWELFFFVTTHQVGVFNNAMGWSGLRGSVRSGNTSTEKFYPIFIKLGSVCLTLASNCPRQQANSECFRKRRKSKHNCNMYYGKHKYDKATWWFSDVWPYHSVTKLGCKALIVKCRFCLPSFGT